MQRQRVFRLPSLRSPFEVLFLICCVVLAGFVLVPEIWGSGKTKDYPLDVNKVVADLKKKYEEHKKTNAGAFDTAMTAAQKK